MGTHGQNQRISFRTWTSCDGALWASELCDNSSELPLGIGWDTIKADCTIEHREHSWISRGQACDITQKEDSERFNFAKERPVILLVDSTFGDVNGLCGCTDQRIAAGLYCTEPTLAEPEISDLRPMDWVVFGLVSRKEFDLRHSRCPFIGNETEVKIDAVVFTDRELHYGLHHQLGENIHDQKDVHISPRTSLEYLKLVPHSFSAAHWCHWRSPAGHLCRSADGRLALGAAGVCAHYARP
jgi:hypothetical protein